MRKTKFVPEGELEKAILKKDNGKIIELSVEAAGKDGRGSTRPNVLATGEFYSLPVRTAAVVLACGMNGLVRRNALSFMRRRHLEYVIGSMDDVISVPGKAPLEDEEKLMQAVMAGDSRKVRFLVDEEHCAFRSLTKARCAVLSKAALQLVPHALVLLLTDGIHCASVPVLLNFLLEECERAEDGKEKSYPFLLLLLNLFIHILQGEITPEDDALLEEDWYPMGESVEKEGGSGTFRRNYSCYYDPLHIYKPRRAEGKRKR